jgi:membrane-associated phospholipid phosphatase
MSVYLLLGVTLLIFVRRRNPWPLTVFLLSFTMLWAVAGFVWSVYPSTNVIRPAHLDNSLLQRLVKLNYGPGHNTLPSGHNMTAWLCAFSLITERIRHAWLFVLWAALISAATLLVRQHYILDVTVSIPAAFGASWLVDRAIRGTRAQPMQTRP